MMPLPLILIPGMMCDARLFGPQIDALSARHPLHLAPIAGHDTVEAMAHAILVSAPLRFALAGLSLGGIVAMEIMAQAPARVERLALLDTNPRAESARTATRREAQIARVQAGGLTEVMRDELTPTYPADGAKRQEVIDLCMDMASGFGPEVFTRQSNALRARPDQQAALTGVRVPTLILCGEHDRLCPVAHHELMHSLIPGSQLEVISDAGHLPTLERAEATNLALTRWLQA